MSKSITKILIHLRGITPLLMNRDDIVILDPAMKKQKNEDYIEHQERVWKRKAHYNPDNSGNIIIPDTWIRKSLIASQGLNANPIRPPNSKKARDTMKTYFVSAILVDNSNIFYENKLLTENDLIPFKKMVSPQGKGKVLCIRPMIKAGWEIKTEILACDDMIRQEHLYEALEWAGSFNGMGDWRAQKGGLFGRFEIIK